MSFVATVQSPVLLVVTQVGQEIVPVVVIVPPLMGEVVAMLVTVPVAVLGV